MASGNDWNTPKAMAIPKEGYFTLEQGRYGPTYPRTPACHGFTIIAKIKPGTEEEIRAYGTRIENTIDASPHALAPLHLHYLRWVLFDIGPDKYFMYQGIFDTDFDKYTEDAIELFSATGVNTIFEKLEGFPDGLEDERTRRSSSSSANTSVQASSNTGNTRTSRRAKSRRRSRSSRHSRPCSTKCSRRPNGSNTGSGRHSALSADANPRAGGQIRVSQLRERHGGSDVARRSAGQSRHGRSVGTRLQTRDGSPLRSRITVCARSGSTTDRSRPSPRSFDRAWLQEPRFSAFTGHSHPDQWVGDLASPALHAIVILFARDVAERDRCEQQHRQYLSTLAGVTVVSALNLEALPPFDGIAREHFGYRDRLSEPVIEGNGRATDAGLRTSRLKPANSSSAIEDESGTVPPLPQPELLSRNGSYLAYLRMEEHVGVFREFLRQQADTPDQQELLAAKLMGRWRSGAPLVLCPDQGRSGAGRRSAADQRLSLQGCRPARVPLPDWRAHPADEPPRHRREHATPKNDPARRHLWAAIARGRAGRWGGARDRCVHRLRQSDSPV